MLRRHRGQRGGPGRPLSRLRPPPALSCVLLLSCAGPVPAVPRAESGPAAPRRSPAPARRRNASFAAKTAGELIVLNDCSSDGGSSAVIDEMRNQRPRLLPLGLSWALRNHLIRRARLRQMSCLRSVSRRTPGFCQVAKMFLRVWVLGFRSFFLFVFPSHPRSPVARCGC